MSVHAAPTPNPNAMKFSVGAPTGGPSTFVKGSATGIEFADELLELDGVASLFMTADFVTITKTPDSSWESISPQAVTILERHFAT